MVNKILEGIVAKLNMGFNEEYPIHTEIIEQGLKEPCFSVANFKAEVSRYRGDRFFNDNQFIVYYFPKNKDIKNKEEINHIKSKLYMILEYIEVDECLMRGTKMRSEFFEGVLLFYVNYDYFSYENKVRDSMEKCSVVTN